MARKRSIETIDKDISKFESRENSLMLELEKVRTEKDKLIAERNDILAQQRRQNTDMIGEIIYSAVGEDISAERFKEIWDAALMNSEVKNMIMKDNSDTAPIPDSDTSKADISADTDAKKEAC